nr:IS6 family transposase [Altericroceibacterium xinjiangense]
MKYVRFPPSLRNVEDLLSECGICCLPRNSAAVVEQVGPMFAADIRRQRVSRMRGFRHWKRYLDEMYVRMNGKIVHLSRAVNYPDEVSESYVTWTRDKAVALRFTRARR